MSKFNGQADFKSNDGNKEWADCNSNDENAACKTCSILYSPSTATTITFRIRQNFIVKISNFLLLWNSTFVWVYKVADYKIIAKMSLNGSAKLH